MRLISAREAHMRGRGRAHHSPRRTIAQGRLQQSAPDPPSERYAYTTLVRLIEDVWMAVNHVLHPQALAFTSGLKKK